METLAIIGTVVSVAAAAGGAIQGMNAASAERQQYEEQAKIAETAAIQDEAQRRQELTRVLASQDAIRAGRGLDLYSPTGNAIRAGTIEQAETDIRTSNLNYAGKSRFYGLGAEAADAKGTQALFEGFAGVGKGLLSGAQYLK